jgi:hypothetical protein
VICIVDDDATDVVCSLGTRGCRCVHIGPFSLGEERCEACGDRLRRVRLWGERDAMICDFEPLVVAPLPHAEGRDAITTRAFIPHSATCRQRSP